MKIKELLSDRSKWTKGYSALDTVGWIVTPNSPDAVCWCLYGAIRVCYPDFSDLTKVGTKLNDTIQHKIGNKSITYIIWQDQPERTFEEVKALVEELDI